MISNCLNKLMALTANCESRKAYVRGWALPAYKQLTDTKIFTNRFIMSYRKTTVRYWHAIPEDGLCALELLDNANSNHFLINRARDCYYGIVECDVVDMTTLRK